MLHLSWILWWTIYIATIKFEANAFKSCTLTWQSARQILDIMSTLSVKERCRSGENFLNAHLFLQVAELQHQNRKLEQTVHDLMKEVQHKRVTVYIWNTYYIYNVERINEIVMFLTCFLNWILEERYKQKLIYVINSLNILSTWL